MPGRRQRRSELSALRNRVTSNQYSTLERFEARRRTVLLAEHGQWNATDRDQSVGLAVWYAALSWQIASDYLEGGTEDDGDSPAEVIAGAEQLSTQAERWTDFAVRIEAQTGRVAQIGLQELWLPPVTDLTGRAAWRAADSVAGWVERDWTMLGAQPPTRFADVAASLQTQYQPALQLIAYLREQWLLTTEAPVYANLATRAVGPAAEILRVGQKMWAPYLIGTQYTRARTRRLGLTDLDLGFDPWLLTDRATAARRRNDPAAQEALNAFWQGLARPQSARQVAAELADALRRRRIRYRSPDGLPLPPWPSQYMVRFPIRLGERTFVGGDLVSLFVTDAPAGQRAVEIRKAGRLTTRAGLLGA